MGIVFRSPEAVLGWLELHSGALSEALSNTTETEVAGADIDGVAAESLRVLRTAAVATLPLRADRSAGIVMTAAFLVEQDLWEQFKAEVSNTILKLATLCR